MSRSVLPLMMAVLMLLAVLASARRLEGEKWTGGEAAASGEHPVIQFSKHLYMQQLPAGSSCTSNSRNNPCRP
ncbi:hypothetical protein GQ55_1G379100 [Panicum hallii var. hallii]|uniref:Uncharacterized protein n=2 Tax=Panicum hallii TaxID=206008 RepID=A0A2T7FBS4_9POAL|nr:hypothetical protein GQ55_1G379100 [Panicum hallii var. hallii]PVH66927.1 hypothetical protein PAHAL_1G386400 [Panicum hallii]